MKVRSELRTGLVEIQFSTRGEARMALDRLDEIADVTVDIVRARVDRGNVAYELLIHGPAREVRRAVRECEEWSTEAYRALAFAS
jgi:hypothetical protein